MARLNKITKPNKLHTIDACTVHTQTYTHTLYTDMPNAVTILHTAFVVQCSYENRLHNIAKCILFVNHAVKVMVSERLKTLNWLWVETSIKISNGETKKTVGKSVIITRWLFYGSIQLKITNMAIIVNHLNHKLPDNRVQ